MMWILFMMFSVMKRWRKRETDRGCKVVLDPWSSRPVGETLAVVGGAGGIGFFHFLHSEKHIILGLKCLLINIP